MITIAFTLSGLALLAIQVAAMDLLLLIQELDCQVAENFGHDAKIFPDFTP